MPSRAHDCRERGLVKTHRLLSASAESKLFKSKGNPGGGVDRSSPIVKQQNTVCAGLPARATQKCLRVLLLSSSCSVSQLSSKERSCRDYHEALQTGGVHCVSLCLDRHPQLLKKERKTDSCYTSIGFFKSSKRQLIQNRGKGVITLKLICLNTSELKLIKDIIRQTELIAFQLTNN